MNQDLLHGKLVRITVDEPAALAEAIVRWNANSEYLRLLDAESANQYSLKKMTDWIQKDQEKAPPEFFLFSVHKLGDDLLIGVVGLDRDVSPHGDAFVGIGIGDKDYWGKGYGTDAMQVILRFAFMELNLRRVSLDAFGYNPRAIHSYEKAGFVHEGRARNFLLREGRRWDLLFMGILREEWLAKQSN